MPSNKFVVEDVMLGEYPLKGVQFTITEKVETPVLGKKTLTKYFKATSFEKDNELVLIPKKAVKKPKPAKPAKTPATKTE